MRVGGILLMVICSLLWGSREAKAESCLTGGCHAAYGKVHHPHQPVADGECLSCHVSVAAEHPQKGVKSFELAEQGSALCYQCHDPLGKKRVVHPPVAEGDCLICHQVHGGVNPFLLTSGEDQSELCFTCHDATPFRQTYRHGPAAVGACTECHAPHESAGKGLLRGPPRDTCLNCHQDFDRKMKAAPVIHTPVKNAPCTDCHDPHASGSPFILTTRMPDLCFTCHPEVGERLANAKFKHKPMEQPGSCGSCHSTHFSQAKGLLPTDEKSLCLGCHGGDDASKPNLKNIRKELERKHLHGPLRQGGCRSCHDPHSSDSSRLLTGPYPEGLYFPYQPGAYDFCLQCHDKNLLRFEETTLYTKFRNGNQNLHHIHVTNQRKGRTCRICHESHGAEEEKLISRTGAPFGDWNIPIRFEQTSTGGSCAPGCHSPFSYDREKPQRYPSDAKR